MVESNVKDHPDLSTVRIRQWDKSKGALVSRVQKCAVSSSAEQQLRSVVKHELDMI